MVDISGKTYSVLKRMAHFYDPAEAGAELLQLVEVFGRRLELTEAQIYAVLRAHAVETADNEGSRGFTAPLSQRGDLDKLFSLYLGHLGGTSQLVRVSPVFTHRSLDARRLARTLLEERTPLVAYLRQRFADWALLERYAVEQAYFGPAELAPELALQLLKSDTPLKAYLAERLLAGPSQLKQLFGSGAEGAALTAQLRTALAIDLNALVLPDPELLPANYAELLPLRLAEPAWPLILSLYQPFMAEQYGRESDPLARRQLLDRLEQTPRSTTPGDDTIRLNRLLLEAAFPYDANQRPWGVAAGGQPGLGAVEQALLGAFNALLEDPALVTGERFPALADQLPRLRQRYRGDLARLNRLALESAFPAELQASHAPYRERMLGLIQVLRRGASTRQGITDIVAANLGIVGEGPQVREARRLIEIEEYLPQQTTFFSGPLSLFQQFALNNPNPDAGAAEFRLLVLASPIQQLSQPQLVHVDSGASLTFLGTLGKGDRLVFSAGRILINGIAAPPHQVKGQLPDAAPGVSRWRFEAGVVGQDGVQRPSGRFDQYASRFDDAGLVVGEPVVQLEAGLFLFTPGVFTVTIPWHIPGFTDSFEETLDHPRQQILGLVNRVKAAGVRALVAYKQGFQERHDVEVRLRLEVVGEQLHEEHAAEERFTIDSRQTGSEQHELGDGLVLAGSLDFTHFDSLNRFA